MANKTLLNKVKLIPKEEIILKIHSAGTSIRNLGKQVCRTEKTIRNCLNDGYMHEELAVQIENIIGCKIRDQK